MTDDTRSKYDPLLLGHDVEAARRISRQVRSGVELPPSTFREFLPELSGRCLNLARHNMPQIEANSTVPDLVEKGGDERERVDSIIRAGGSRTSHYTVMQHFLASLVKRGVRFTDRAVPVRDLSPTQADVDPNKVYGMADTFLRGDLRKDRILVSRDGYILDGHHRWAALALVNPARMQSVREIGMSIKDLLDESLKFPGVFKEGVSKKASRPEDELKKCLHKLLRAWSDAVITNIGPSARVRNFSTFAYGAFEEHTESSSGWSVIMDKRLPRHTAINVTGEMKADGSTSLRLNLTIPYEWKGFTSEKIRDSANFDVKLEGDAEQLHLDAGKHARALADVVRFVISIKEGVSKKVAAKEESLGEQTERVFRAWVDSVLSGIGPSARASNFESMPHGDNGFGVECRITDPRFPNADKSYLSMWARSLKWGSSEPQITVNMSCHFEDVWWSDEFLEYETGTKYFEVNENGRMVSMARAAASSTSSFTGVMLKVIEFETRQRRREATEALHKRSPAIVDGIRDELIKDGAPRSIKVLAYAPHGLDDAYSSFAPHLTYPLVIEGYLDRKRGRNRDEVKRVGERVRETLVRALDKSSKNGVIAELSEEPLGWSSNNYNTSFYLYYADGKAHLSKMSYVGEADALRAATIRLAHAEPKLRPHLLPLLAGTAPHKKATR